MAGPVTRGAIPNPDRRIRSYSNEIPSRGAGGGRVSRLGGSTTAFTGGTRPGPGDGKLLTTRRSNLTPDVRRSRGRGVETGDRNTAIGNGIHPREPRPR